MNKEQILTTIENITNSGYNLTTEVISDGIIKSEFNGCKLIFNFEINPLTISFSIPKGPKLKSVVKTIESLKSVNYYWTVYKNFQELDFALDDEKELESVLKNLLDCCK